MRNIFSAIALTGALVIGGFAASTSNADAGGRLDIRIGGPGFYLGFDDRRDFRPRNRFHRKCHPRKALKKARKRFGLRGAYVARVGRRGVIVRGYRWGTPVKVGFARHRSCPVRFVRHR